MSKSENWDNFFKLLKQTSIPYNFMAEREDSLPQERDIFKQNFFLKISIN